MMKGRIKMYTNNVQSNFAEEIAKNGLLMIKNGKVRNHKLGNSARIHYGEIEKNEYQTYRDFLPGKNACMVFELTGSNIYD